MVQQKRGEEDRDCVDGIRLSTMGAFQSVFLLSDLPKNKDADQPSGGPLRCEWYPAGSSEEWLYDVFMRIGQYQIEEWAVVTESLTCDGLWSIEYLTQPDLTRGRHEKQAHGNGSCTREAGTARLKGTVRLPSSPWWAAALHSATNPFFPLSIFTHIRNLSRTLKTYQDNALFLLRIFDTSVST
ncbi:hypothetical protein C8R48DRAFT_676702 [Suillus tomentosus]|nr:hypothetical protein C8R48DRAFT_676702 [Suillus tomentosus]